MKKFFQEFKDFIQKGNILDLAVGIIIGTAFNKIVSSLVNDIIMPLFGLLGGRNFQEGKLVLVDAVLDSSGNIIQNAVTLNYGAFVQYIIDFLIISFTVFVIVKVLKGMRDKAEAAKQLLAQKLKAEQDAKDQEVKEQEEKKEPEEVKPTTEEILLEIRDILMENKTK